MRDRVVSIIRGQIRKDRKRMEIAIKLANKPGFKNRATYQLPIYQQNVKALELIVWLYKQEKKKQ